MYSLALNIATVCNLASVDCVIILPKRMAVGIQIGKLKPSTGKTMPASFHNGISVGAGASFGAGGGGWRGGGGGAFGLPCQSR